MATMAMATDTPALGTLTFNGVLFWTSWILFFVGLLINGYIQVMAAATSITPDTTTTMATTAMATDTTALGALTFNGVLFFVGLLINGYI